jgi:hypothetical protein
MEAEEENKHSELGIASTGIGIFDILLWIYIFSDSFSAIPNLIIPIFMSTLCLPTIAFILGLFGLLQDDRKKTYPLLGTGLSILEFLVFFFMAYQVSW